MINTECQAWILGLGTLFVPILFPLPPAPIPKYPERVSTLGVHAMPRVFTGLIAVVVCSLGSVAHEARAQVVPISLEASGVLANVDPSVYPGVSPGTAYSIKYDLMLDTSAPFSIGAGQSSWTASGTVTLDIDGQASIAETAASPIQILDDPFNDGRDMIRFVLNIPGGGFRTIGLLTDANSDLLADLNQAPSATLINELPAAQQVSSTFAFNEQSTAGPFVLNGNVTALEASGGAPPPAPVITSEPFGDIVDSGDVVNLQVIAEGYDLSHQWYKDGVPLTDGPGIAGSQTRRLQFTANENARYGCVVTNPGGSVTSAEVIVAVNNTCPADQNNDGMLSPTDFTAWIANYNAGCP